MLTDEQLTLLTSIDENKLKMLARLLNDVAFVDMEHSARSGDFAFVRDMVDAVPALVEEVRRVREGRDEARAEVERLRSDLAHHVAWDEKAGEREHCEECLQARRRHLG
jgi:hypothetical protein